ncbi:MAG TPA: hypothetical protein PLP34_01250, partial [Chitinophagaceae bacterium]|nr:hypothetical protein [Chitinophagaceae bacterium]
MKNALCFFLLLTIKTATLYAQLIPAGRYQIQVAGKKTEKGSRYAEFQTDGSYRLEWNGRDTLPGQT